MSESSFTEEQIARIKAVGRELADKIGGTPKLAAELSMKPVDVMSVLRGPKSPTREFAEGIARIKGVPLQELLSPKTTPAYPNRAEAIAIARRDGISDAAILEIEAQRPATDRPLLDWLLSLREAQQRHARASTAKPASPSAAGTEPPSLLAPATIAEAPPTIQSTVAAATPTMQSSAHLAASPPPAPIEPTRREPEARQPTLTMLEFASVSMGLEVLPHRREDVFRRFGLESDAACDAEIAAWDRYFEENPRDRREWQQMRERMRNHWIEFDKKSVADGGRTSGATFELPPTVVSAPPLPGVPQPPIAPPPAPPASVRSTLSTGAALAPPTAPGVPPTAAQQGNETALYLEPIVFPGEAASTTVTPTTAAPTMVTPRMALEDYARIGVELQLTPHDAERIFARYGLSDPRAREAEDAAWRARLAADETERARWERLCAEWRLRLAPVTQPATATHSQQSTAAQLPAPPIDIAEYALLCVELEKQPQNKEAIYARHGLVTPAKRRAVDDVWRARLAALPAERAEWQAIVDRLRDGWIDL